VETDSFAGGQTAESDGNDGLPASSDTLFLGAEPAIVAARQQVGCIRFSHVPQGALVPRLHRCDRGPMPAFRSQRYADPGYFQLAPSVPDSIRRGAEDGGEMGAGNLNADMVRHDNITRSIHDFLRFGHSAGIFLERAPAMAGRDRP
jgi:hypothetical protein